MATILDTALLQAPILTGQTSPALELLKGLQYCDLKISEEFLHKRNQYACLLEIYRCNSIYHDALKLLHRLIEYSKADKHQTKITLEFKPEMIIEYLKTKVLVAPSRLLHLASQSNIIKPKENNLGFTFGVSGHFSSS